jgi:hypothetical protein
VDPRDEKHFNFMSLITTPPKYKGKSQFTLRHIDEGDENILSSHSWYEIFLKYKEEILIEPKLNGPKRQKCIFISCPWYQNYQI